MCALMFPIAIVMACSGSPARPLPVEPDPNPVAEPATEAPPAPKRPWPASRRERVVDVAARHAGRRPLPLARGREERPRSRLDDAQDNDARAACTLPGATPARRALKQLYYVDSISAPSPPQGALLLHAHATRPRRRRSSTGSRARRARRRSCSIRTRGAPTARPRWAPGCPRWTASGSPTRSARTTPTRRRSTCVTSPPAPTASSTSSTAPSTPTPTWTPDGDGFYYTWLPPTPRSRSASAPATPSVRFHKLGDRPDERPRWSTPRRATPRRSSGRRLARRPLAVHVRAARVERDRPLLARHRLEGRVTAWKPLVVGVPRSSSCGLEGSLLRHDRTTARSRCRVLQGDPSSPTAPSGRRSCPRGGDAHRQRPESSASSWSLTYVKNATSELRVTTLDGRLVRTLPLPGVGDRRRPQRQSRRG